MKLLLMQVLKSFTKIKKKIFCDNICVLFKKNIWIDTKHTFHECWKKIIKYFAGKKNFQCVWRCLIEHTKTLFSKEEKSMLIFLCIVRVKILNWFKNNYSWMLQKKIKHLAKKSFRVFNWTPLDTLKDLFGQIIYYYFSTSKKSVFCISSKNLFQQYTDVVNKILLIM